MEKLPNFHDTLGKLLEEDRWSDAVLKDTAALCKTSPLLALATLSTFHEIGMPLSVSKPCVEHVTEFNNGIPTPVSRRGSDIEEIPVKRKKLAHHKFPEVSLPRHACDEDALAIIKGYPAIKWLDIKCVPNYIPYIEPRLPPLTEEMVKYKNSCNLNAKENLLFQDYDWVLLHKYAMIPQSYYDTKLRCCYAKKMCTLYNKHKLTPIKECRIHPRKGRAFKQIDWNAPLKPAQKDSPFCASNCQNSCRIDVNIASALFKKWRDIGLFNDELY